MEAVPRLPMVSFDLRQSAEPCDFGPKLKQFIRNHYNEDPDMFDNELNQLEGLRFSAVRPTKDVAGCATLKRYYCQLHFLSSRFPMTKDGEAAVKFSWKHLSNNTTCSASDITLEMSSILYNIGAIHSQLGASDNRTTSDGMKMSCTHFQCAAWAFQHICEEYVQSSGLDLSLDLMSFMSKLCLGQAQECILEKSMMDNRKATIIAKVSVQTVDYYKQALKIISDAADESSLVDLVGSKMCKKWEKYLKFKISYHGSIALLFQGQQAEEQQEMGQRVAFYQASFEKLEEARKLSKGLDNIEAVNEALTFVHDVVEGKRKAAKNENEFIYHEDIPDINALPDVKGASLVKGIPFNVNDVEVSGPDIFGRIIPIEAHKSSSLYSEEKARLLRHVVNMIENKDEELETFLSTLKLDELNNTDGNQLPQELIDRCAALSAKPDAVKDLLDSMNNLSSIYHNVEAMLSEIKEKLIEEQIHEKEYQEAVGKRPPSIAATDLTREAKKYEEAHSKASESNQTLHKAMVLHIGNMKLLSLPLRELMNHIPAVVESPEVEAVTKEMRHLVNKVNEMKQQRLFLSDRLRESIYQDDILRQVVTYSGENLQALFDKELQKHQRTVSLIEQNLAAQENILKAIKDVYARYGTTRKNTCEMHRKREAMVAALISSYDAYEDLLAKSSKGLDFYKKLEVNVSKLLQRVKGTCRVQDEEREQLIKSVKNTENQETIPSATLKLKDYLDMKKEFGTLSLDNTPVPPSNPYYKPDQVSAQTWIPGVRPAPVGSEGKEAISRIDSYPGYCQGRDQIWSNVSYNQDDRMKYYPSSSESSRTYSTEPQTMPQDIYPISAYSSVMQNTSNSGYAGPKSNYYNTQNSPSRYINPPQFYIDYTQPTIANYPATTTSCKPNDNDEPQTSYSSCYPNTQYNPSDVSSNAYVHPQSYQFTSIAKTDSYQYQYPTESVAAPSYSVNIPDSSNPIYRSSVSDFESKYITPGDQTTSSYYSVGAAPSPSLSYTDYNPPQTYVQPAVSKVQGDYGYSTWQPFSGNESVYTACQTNNYALTNSDGYCQTTPYNQTNYTDQYYVNQYGAYNGQNELGHGNSMTYMQAGYDKQQSTITYSNSDTKPSPSTEHSNVDLLAGLDFSINQSPLVPEPSNIDVAPEVENPAETKVIAEATSATETPEMKKKQQTETSPTKDSFADMEKINQFSLEVEKYEKFVEGLTMKTLNGPTCLDLKWKEISDLQDKSNHLRIISVARCYPMKNRFPDILPYDDSRVELPSTKDDYINASLMKSLTPLSPNFILTQAPMPSTFNDFWAMVYEQQVEVIVCLLNDSELGGHFYWPLEKGQELAMGKLKLSLQSSNVKPHWTERIMSLCASESRVTRVIIHFQFTSWPGSSFPESPGPFLTFASECINFFNQQRSSSHPVVVHCTSGVGRSGLFCLIVAALLDIQSGKGIPDLVAVTGRMCQFRKSALRDKEHLKFAYQAVLYFSQDLLMKRGFLTNRAAFDDKKMKEGKCHTRHPSEDFLLGPPTDITNLQSGIEKLGFECPPKRNESADVRSQSACGRRESSTNSNSCTSSGRNSPSSLPSDVLSTLDPANFTLKIDSGKSKSSAKKRYTIDSFAKKSELSLDGFNTESEDPLSRLDPLWTIKK